MEEFFAGIVTYNPNIRQLRKNIDAIVPQVKRLVIVDNGSKNINEIKELLTSKCQLIENGSNLGIAHGLNQIMKISDLENVEWVLLLDQDSVCPFNIIDEYRKYIGLKKVAILTPIIRDRYNPMESNSINEYDEIIEFITSGSFNCITPWKKVNGFNDNLFIDMVDYDYAYKLQQFGYKSYRVNSIGLSHAIGKNKIYRLGIFKVKSYNHNAFRKYYITRNSLYLSAFYPRYCNPVIVRLKIIKRFLLVILFENDKKEKVKSMLKGAWDSHKFIREERKK